MRRRGAAGLRDALMKQPLVKRYQINGRTIGTCRRMGGPGGKVFLLLMRTEAHFYIKGQSVGVATWAFEDAVGRKAESVIVVYEGRGTLYVYEAPVLMWKSKGFIVKEEEYEEQIHLAVRRMRTMDKDPPEKDP